MSKNINKKELINHVSEKIKQTEPSLKISKKEIELIMDSLLKSISDTLQKGNKVSFIGFGSFTVKNRKATIKTNPKDTTKKIKVPAKKLVRFKASDKLNDTLN
jgi:DNA-binding protein HU-beta